MCFVDKQLVNAQFFKMNHIVLDQRLFFQLLELVFNTLFCSRKGFDSGSCHALALSLF